MQAGVSTWNGIGHEHRFRSIRRQLWNGGPKLVQDPSTPLGIDRPQFVLLAIVLTDVVSAATSDLAIIVVGPLH